MSQKWHRPFTKRKRTSPKRLTVFSVLKHSRRLFPIYCQLFWVQRIKIYSMTPYHALRLINGFYSIASNPVHYFRVTFFRRSFKGGPSRYFESFLRRTKIPLKWRKPLNNSLLRKKNPKEVILTQKGTRMEKIETNYKWPIWKI